MECDVLVLGAGAAGLAAAADLSAAGLSVRILEARERTGGRIETLQPEGLQAPVEMGAEFVHELTDDVRELVHRAGARLIELTGEHWRADGGVLRRDEQLFARVGDVLGRMSELVPPDMTVADALGRVRDASADDRRRARQYVEGYHAADITRASMQAIAVAEDGGDEPAPAGTQYRIDGGYDVLVRALQSMVPSDALVPGVRVMRVSWRAGDVHVQSRQSDGTTRTDHAGAVVVTLPLPMLFGDGPDVVVFDPSPPAFGSVSRSMAMGSALRVALQFREPFWRNLRSKDGRRADDAAFFHTASERLPVWWTQHPRDVPLLIGWAGGPPARELATLDDGALQIVARDVLSEQLGASRTTLDDLLTGFWRSRWDEEPYARGAYSYVLKDGVETSSLLEQPVENTLYFAGEAFAGQSARGTVTGALASGRSAARALMKRFSLRS